MSGDDVIRWELEIKPWEEKDYWLSEGWEPLAVFRFEHVDHPRPPHKMSSSTYFTFSIVFRRAVR